MDRGYLDHSDHPVGIAGVIRGGEMRTYKDADASILQSIPNVGVGIEIRHTAQEVTFLGVQNQPDFGTLDITLYPTQTVPELRSLKEYLYHWRDIVVSYERFMEVVYEQIMEVYEPNRLRLTLETNVRGGITSRLTIDSDWNIRGGEERYKDWRD